MRRYLFYGCLIVILLVSGCSSGSGERKTASTPLPPTANPEFNAAQPARVLRLDSYHPDYLWSEQIDEGVRRGLAERGYSEDARNLEIDVFYMDTKRRTDARHYLNVAESARAYILDQQPDVVIASDNNAIRLVVQTMASGDIPFVFNGLNDNPATYGLSNSPNVTGVLERAHIEGTLKWIAAVFPDATQITCIFDISVTTDAYYNAVRAALDESRFAGSMIFITDSLVEWQTLVQAADDTSAVIVVGTYHTLKDANGDAVHEDTVIRWTVENSTVPIVPFWDFSMPFGALGGDVISGDTQGYEAGLKAAMILGGTSPADIPITAPEDGRLVVNPAAAARWNVTIPVALLEASELYTPPTE